MFRAQSVNIKVNETGKVVFVNAVTKDARCVATVSVFLLELS